MKKAINLLLALVISAGLFAACGSQSGTQSPSQGDTQQSTISDADSQGSGEPVKLTIWHEGDATIADTIQQQLNDIPGVQATLERKEQLANALKLAGNDPNSAPDMYLWAHDKIGVFAEMGILAPVTDILGESELADMLPMAIDAGTYEGSLYQLPIYFETLLFMYNKALMSEPPATTDELLAAMKANSDSDRYAFVEMHSTAYYAAAWIQGFGGYIINSEKKPGLDQQGTIDALAYHSEFVPYMSADGEYNTVTTLFTEGKAASIISGPWLVPGLKAAGMDLGIAPMPKLPNGNPLTPFSGVQGVSVLKHAAQDAGKVDAVGKVLRALAEPDTGIALAKAANSAPVNTKAYDDAEVAANEMIAVMRQTADNVIPMPNVPEMDVMWSVTETALVSINKNEGEAAAVCASAQKDALEQIANMQ